MMGGRELHGLVVGLLGGFVDLDATAIGQVMLSQPIVAAPLVGLALGALDGIPAAGLQIGLMVGSILQLLWIEQLPLGMNVPPDAALASVLAVSLGYLAGYGSDSYVTREVGNTVALLLAVPVGLVGRSLDMFIRRVNTSLDRRVTERIQAGRRVALAVGHLLGGLLTFGKAMLVCMVIVWLGIEPLRFFVRNLNFNQFTGFIVIQGLLPAVGFAVLASRCVQSGREVRLMVLGVAAFTLLPRSLWLLLAAALAMIVTRWQRSPGAEGRERRSAGVAARGTVGRPDGAEMPAGAGRAAPPGGARRESGRAAGEPD